MHSAGLTIGQAYELTGNQFNVTRFGAKLDGVTDDTAAWAAAVAAARSVGAQTYAGRAATIIHPGGLSIVSGIDLDKGVSIVGPSEKTSSIRLKTGSNRSLIKVLPRAAGGDSYPANMEYSELVGLGLDGNLAEQTGTSYVIECPNSAFPLGTQYNRSVALDRCSFDFGRSGGIYLGDNRNWAIIRGCRSWYSTGPAVVSYGYDHRFSDNDFSGTVGTTTPVINLVAGGACTFYGCNSYLSGGPIVAISAFVNSYVEFNACDFSAAAQQLMYVAGAATARGIKLIGCRFNLGNTGNVGFPAIELVSPAVDDVTFSLCSFPTNAQKVTRLIYSNVAYAVRFKEILYDAGSVPWSVERFNALITDRG